MNSKPYLIIALTFIVATSLYGGTNLRNFAGYPSDNSVTLDWESAEESNLFVYQVERSVSGGAFAYIGKVDPRGNYNKYSYTDETIFAKSAGRIYTYRIKIVDMDDSFSYSPVITITPTLSAARETWGSIKALFR